MSAVLQNSCCEGRVDNELQERLSDLRRLWSAYCEGDESLDDLGGIHEYGLSFDFVASGTFGDQRESYFRYQLSWGGPSDEFRFFTGADLACHRVEYWFLDWFDGAQRTLSGTDEAFLLELWKWFSEYGAVDSALKESGS